MACGQELSQYHDRRHFGIASLPELLADHQRANAPKGLTRYFSFRRIPKVFFDDEEIRRLERRIAPEARDSIVAVAQHVVEKRFEIHAFATHRFPAQTLWSSASCSNRNWHRELNRSGFLAVLALALTHAREPLYLKTVERILNDRTRRFRLTFDDLLDLTLRIHVWAWAYALIRQEASWIRTDLPGTIRSAVFAGESFVEVGATRFKGSPPAVRFEEWES